MDRQEYIHKRKGRYMAQVLEHFEVNIEKQLPASAAPAIDDFKGLVRARFNALATDSSDVIGLAGEAQNAHSLEIRDQIAAAGR